MNIEDRKRWIDNATYEQLLRRWRNAPIGSSWFQGELGDYYLGAMKTKRASVGHDEHVRASKAIGWDG